MGRCNCGATEAQGCQCSLTDSDCFSVTGAGSAENPFAVEANLDPDTENLMECSASGLAAFLPPEIAEPPRCQIVLSSDMTVPTSTIQIVDFDLVAVYDSASMYDGPTNNTRMNVQMDGLYHVSGQVGWEEPATDAYASWAIYQMPSDTAVVSVGLVITSGPGSPVWRTHGDNDWELEAGDYLQMRVFQNTGSDLKVVGARITARRVAPLT